MSNGETAVKHQPIGEEELSADSAETKSVE